MVIFRFYNMSHIICDILYVSIKRRMLRMDRKIISPLNTKNVVLIKVYAL